MARQIVYGGVNSPYDGRMKRGHVGEGHHDLVGFTIDIFPRD